MLTTVALGGESQAAIFDRDYPAQIQLLSSFNLRAVFANHGGARGFLELVARAVRATQTIGMARLTRLLRRAVISLDFDRSCSGGGVMGSVR